MLKNATVEILIQVILCRLWEKPSSLFLSAIYSRVNVSCCLESCEIPHHVLVSALELGVLVLYGIELFLCCLVQMIQIYFQLWVVEGVVVLWDHTMLLQYV